MSQTALLSGIPFTVFAGGFLITSSVCKISSPEHRRSILEITTDPQKILSVMLDRPLRMKISRSTSEQSESKKDRS